MSDNIVQFPGKHRSVDQDLGSHLDPSPELQMKLVELFSDYLSDLPQIPMMNNCRDMVSNHLTRTLMFTTVCARAMDYLRREGFPAEKFTVNEVSVNNFMTGDLFGLATALQQADDTERLWNGPRFDGQDGDTKMCLATSVVLESDGAMMCAMDVLRLEPEAENWEIYFEGDWVEGPPRQIFNFLDIGRMTRSVMEQDRFSEFFEDDDDDDDWPDFDIDDDDSLYDLGLSDRIVRALKADMVNTVEDLIALRPQEVLAIRGIGRASLKEIEAMLEYIDLGLRED